MPQAYFSRNALRMGILLVPVIKFYKFILYPVSKPTALLLDQWLGKEGVLYFKEEDFRIMLQKHMESRDSDISRLEGTGALNFLSIDDLPVGDEGELVDPVSIIALETKFDLPVFPAFQRNPDDPFFASSTEIREKMGYFDFKRRCTKIGN